MKFSVEDFRRDPPPVMTVPQLAKFLGVSKFTAYNRVKAWKLHRTDLLVPMMEMGPILIRTSVLLEMLDGNTILIPDQREQTWTNSISIEAVKHELLSLTRRVQRLELNALQGAHAGKKAAADDD